MEDKKTKIQRAFSGIVISNKGDKTAVIQIETVKMHSLYKKRYTTTKHYKVHDENNTAKLGDTVKIVECRPMSKHKRWRIVASTK